MELSDILKQIEFTIPEGKELKDLTTDDFKESFDKKWVGLSVAHENPDIKSKILGKEWGGNETALRRLLRELDIDAGDLKWRDNDGKSGMDVAAELVKAELTKLKESAGNSDDEKLKELEIKLQKANDDKLVFKQKSEDFETQLGEKAKEFDTFKTNFELKTILDTAKSKIEFSETANDLTRKGFFQTIDEKYNFEPDAESEHKVRITDKKTNQVVTDGSKFISPDALFLKEAKEANILKVAQNTPDKKTFKLPQNGNGKNEPVRKISSAAEEHLASLNSAK